VLFGYSLGGRLALHALLAEPQLWDAAVIVAAHPGLVSEAERVERRGRDAGWAAAALKDEWGGFLREWEAQEIFRGGGAAPGDRRLLAPRRAAVARSFIDWSLGAQADLTPRLAAVATPVTWVVGERDGKFRAAGERAVAALGCGALVVLDGCGHRVAWERPGEFAALVAGVAARING
jgi:2-succinyl-6-hydroxy-2,4-cyclohexadiene-1-carboxylate synthase